ncbi:transglycosylase domain-containing protein [Ammoniphilus sp. CFH 90114]|uniref:transglycosylase domain-containing protein n=1 Tax=Ammoniphilus sp. CFH 90114 TaxID=2493665 RepID=UPI001F0C99C9|nr:transglycosylase domain-containing protein [Ammoniphilus sp. CFH 90114]
MKKSLGVLLIILCILLYSILFMNIIREIHLSRQFSHNLNQLVQPDEISLPTNSFMYDRLGALFEEVISEQNRRYISWEEIPFHVIHAFIATEDQYFFDHKGFDVSGITRSFIVNIKKDEIEQGGSTITQQLIRHLYLSNEKTVDRKLKEVLLAYQLEKKLTKQEILELYINAVFFHNGLYGIEAASQFYFSRPTSQLTLAEIAFLCAIPNNPSYYNPLKNFTHTVERQKWILHRMLDMKFITSTELEQAIQQPIQLKIGQPKHLFADYSTYVYHEFYELISIQEGYKEALLQAVNDEEKKVIQERLNQRVQELLHEQGVVIHTGLHPAVQEKAKQLLIQHVPQKKIEGAIAVIDHEKNQILALIGGKDVQRHGFNRVFQSYRQPGSSIKPLLVYGPYVEAYRPSIHSIVAAENICINNYCPKNYGGRQYRKVTLETAVKYSLNTTAVRLLRQIGPEKGFSYLEPFSFSKVTEQDYRLPAALGGFTYGMTPLELTNAYTTFAHQGQYLPARSITKVTDRRGNLLYEWKEQPIRVWSPPANETMRTLLSKVVKEGTAKTADFSSPYIGGKTGTTDQVKDLWFIGLTDRHTAGIWLGSDKPISLASVEKSHPHLRVWKDLMQYVSSELK